MKNKIKYSILIVLFSWLVSVADNKIAIIPREQLKQNVFSLVQSAEEKIWVAHYIIYNDHTGKAFMSMLMKKAKAGVDVRVLIDGVGAGIKFPWKVSELKTFESAGVKIKIYNPKLRGLLRLNHRMHDKILLCDKTVILGSSSIWDMSFYGYLHETDLILEGKSHDEIASHFNSLWSYKLSKQPFYWFQKKVSEDKIAKYIIKNDIGMVDENTRNRLTWLNFKSIEYCNDGVFKNQESGIFKKSLHKLSQAKKEVIIVNPYFFPVKELEKVFVNLIEKGVKIKIYTNSSRSLAKEFTVLGIKYEKQFAKFKKLGLEIWELENFRNVIQVHDKFIKIDDDCIYIGSLNLDRLGSYTNTENGIFINKGDSNKKEFNLLSKELNARVLFIKSQSVLAFKDHAQFIKGGNDQSKCKNILFKCLLPLIKNCF